jgi:hypothetical protein
MKEMEIKENEKEEQKQKHVKEKRERLHLSELDFGKAKDDGAIEERKKAEKIKNTMSLVRIAAEEKELRKTKVFERKMKKEMKKNEKEEQK